MGNFRNFVHGPKRLYISLHQCIPPFQHSLTRIKEKAAYRNMFTYFLQCSNVKVQTRIKEKPGYKTYFLIPERANISGSDCTYFPIVCRCVFVKISRDFSWWECSSFANTRLHGCNSWLESYFRVRVSESTALYFHFGFWLLRSWLAWFRFHEIRFSIYLHCIVLPFIFVHWRPRDISTLANYSQEIPDKSDSVGLRNLIEHPT